VAAVRYQVPRRKPFRFSTSTSIWASIFFNCCAVSSLCSCSFSKRCASSFSWFAVRRLRLARTDRRGRPRDLECVLRCGREWHPVRCKQAEWVFRPNVTGDSGRT
jgi:hypothetical protein